MKRKTSLAVAIASASLVLTACGSESTTDAASTPATSQESVASEPESEVNVDASADETGEETTGEGADDDISVDQGLLSTTVTLPADFVQGQTEEELNAAAKAEGWDTEITLNSDGSATYSLSRGEYNKVMDDLRQSIEESIQTWIDEEPKVYKSITFSDDFRTFDATVNRKALESSMSFLALGLTFSSYIYQSFDGVDADERFMTLNYIDESTGEVFDTYDSRDN